VGRCLSGGHRLRLNPHLHLVALDGAWHEQGGELCWQGLSHLKTSEVGGVLEKALLRMERYLRRRGLLGSGEDDRDLPGDPESALAASAVSGQTPPRRAAVAEGPRAEDGHRPPQLASVSKPSTNSAMMRKMRQVSLTAKFNESKDSKRKPFILKRFGT
jgi:hypothetical protein